MQNTIGVIGATGDLGSKLTQRLKSHSYKVIEYSRSQPESPTINDLVQECAFVHVCAPVISIKDVVNPKAVIILHDSVMNTSREASSTYLNGSAAVVHMLMNQQQSVIVASDAMHHDIVSNHLSSIGLSPHSMTISEHDYMIARSQAPLALLCKTLLPYLYEQADKGLLTPSGQLLADTLHSRELAWTEETIHSILQNPQLETLVHDMQRLVGKNQD